MPSTGRIVTLAAMALTTCLPATTRAQSSDTPVLGVQRIAEGQGGFDVALQPESGLGDGMAVIGDLDGNGVPDIAAGGSTHDDQRGVCWVLLLDTDGTALDVVTIGEGGQGGFTGELPFGNTQFGAGVAGPGDLDGDGIPDLVVTSQVPTSLWVLLLNADGTVKQHSQVPVPGISVWSTPDLAVIGDFDGNGWVDYVVGAPGLAGGQLLLLLMDGIDTILDDVLLSDGIATGFVYAGSVTVPGDLDGNGFPEIVATIGFPQLAHLYFMGAGGSVLGVETWGTVLPGGIDFWVPGNVAPVGDLDGDGVGDLLGSGQWLLFMEPGGVIHHAVEIQPGQGGFPPHPLPQDSYGGPSVLLGDIDGDGRQEVAVGAPLDGFAGIPPAYHPGAVYIVSLEDRWFDMGFGLSGASSPELVGSGSLVGGEAVSLTVSGGPPGAPGTLWFGLTTIDAPFKGGVLVPAIDIGIGLSLDAAGSLAIHDLWPPGFPSGLIFHVQMWMADAGGPVGLAATNAIQARTP